MRKRRLLPLFACLLLTAFSLAARTHLTEMIRPPAASVTGSVVTVSGSMITLMNGIIAIDATGAAIIGRNGPATLASLVPGTRIFASLREATPAGVVPVAVLIHIIDPPAGQLNSTIDRVDVAAGTFSVFGKTIRVTPATRFHASRDNPRNGLADLRVGDLAYVEVDLKDGALVALSVAVVSRPPVVLSGTVRVIGSSSWVIGVDNRDVTVKVTPTTRVVGTPVVGDLVAVVATTDAAGALTAVSIEKKSRPANPSVSLNGTVQTIGSDRWVIDVDGQDVAVIVTPTTMIVGSPEVGDSVEGSATSDAAGALTAVTLEKRTRPSNPSLNLSGKVQIITSSTWVIGINERDPSATVRVTVTPTTRILGSPAVGDVVSIIGSRDAAGVLTAISIEKKTRPSNPSSTLSGKVQVISSTTWVIGINERDPSATIRVTVTSTTRILGSPAVGDVVSIIGTRDAAGVFTATSIEKKTRPAPPQSPATITFEGPVRSITSKEWIVDGRRVFIDRSTRITGSPAVGDLVKVVGTSRPDGIGATSIEKK